MEIKYADLIEFIDIDIEIPNIEMNNTFGASHVEFDAIKHFIIFSFVILSPSTHCARNN